MSYRAIKGLRPVMTMAMVAPSAFVEVIMHANDERGRAWLKCGGNRVWLPRAHMESLHQSWGLTFTVLRETDEVGA